MAHGDLGEVAPGPRGQQQRHRDQQHRPDDVVLLLHPERPGVLQRRGCALGEVVGLLRHKTPVGHPRESGDRVAAQTVERLVGQEFPGHAHAEHHQHQRRQQPAGTPDPEAGQADTAGAPQLVEQQRGDQESAENEEYVDADEPAAHAGNAAVPDENQGDGYRTEAVQRGNAAAAGPPGPMSPADRPGAPGQPNGTWVQNVPVRDCHRPAQCSLLARPDHFLVRRRI